jgi:hypothetical protein
MGLPNYKEEQLKKMPMMEFIVRKSKDGRYIIHKTIVTDIKPIAYYEKVLSNEPAYDEVSADDIDEEIVEVVKQTKAKTKSEA